MNKDLEPTKGLTDRQTDSQSSFETKVILGAVNAVKRPNRELNDFCGAAEQLAMESASPVLYTID